jgi:acetyl esterase/lipase
MPSFQYHLFKPLMHLARWSQGNFPVEDVTAFVRFRHLADRMANVMMRPPREVKMESKSVGGVAGDWFIPANAPEDPVMVFFHGGGIAFGWDNPLRRELAYIAKFSGLRAFGVDYHLVPEYVYPAAHDECYAVFQALVQQGKKTVLIGESSGGVLALATLLRAKAAGLPQPLLCALISPLVDFGFKDTRLWQVDDAFAHPRFTIEMHKHYVAGNDTSLPDLGPIYADLSGIAPLYVLAGEHEFLRGEVDRLAEAAQRYHVPMETLLWPDVWHSWHALAPQLPEATQALKAFATAIRQRVSEHIQGTQ